MSTRIAARNAQLKRAYEPAEAHDGTRVLIDRLWPRGLSKQAAAVDLWLKDIAPSTELRKWFGHDPARWAVFQCRYADELKQHRLRRFRVERRPMRQSDGVGIPCLGERHPVPA
jgi:uncharacterized protein YeaO (DUF488 family)